MGVPEELAAGGAPRTFIELHCHTSASFDSLADPAAVARAAAARGLTHLAITDHDRIDAALRLRDAAPSGLTIIVGEEVKSVDGDLIAIFLREAVPPGLSAVETIAAVREQGGLVGVPHPFDGRRGFGRNSGTSLESIAHLVDWVEAYNARVLGGSANDKAARFAREHGLPGVGASDSHTVIEVGVTYNILTGDAATPAGLLAALAGVDFVPGRASLYVRAWTPIAKIVQSMRGNGRRRTQQSMGETR
ncbi:MAG: PHP domain-containing protein [Candidatus Limnocylindrales bacterium]|jgi:predicted metal-dependent phosphoesterase TrpH